MSLEQFDEETIRQLMGEDDELSEYIIVPALDGVGQQARPLPRPVLEDYWGWVH